MTVYHILRTKKCKVGVCTIMVGISLPLNPAGSARNLCSSIKRSSSGSAIPTWMCKTDQKNSFYLDFPTIVALTAQIKEPMWVEYIFSNCAFQIRKIARLVWRSTGPTVRVIRAKTLVNIWPP